MQQKELLKSIQPVILAGGKSSRMGENKALLRLNGRSLIEIISGKLQQVFTEKPLIVTNTPSEYDFLALPMVSDTYQERGPLGGLEAALCWSKQSTLFVAACDMPCVDVTLVRQMATFCGTYDAVVPGSGDGMMEPLQAFYTKACLPAVTRLLQMEQGRMVLLLQQVNTYYFPTQAGQNQELAFNFVNVNTKDDWLQLKQKW
ncbi:MAG: molybdenum cofactor guanylyltransferase [Sporomusaceae bacterium]|nr:molybdenum cofactor guanylyltransferase [Sporomusaceae bacterium]